MLLAEWLLDYYLYLFDDLLSVTLDKMRNLHHNLLLHLFHNHPLLHHRHLHYLLLNNPIRNDLLYHLGHVHLPLLGVCNESRYLSVEIDCLAIGDYVRDLALDLDVTVALEELLVDDLDLAEFLANVLEVDGLLDHFLYLDVLLRHWHLHLLLHLHHLHSLHHHLPPTRHLHHLLLINRHNPLHLYII